MIPWFGVSDPRWPYKFVHALLRIVMKTGKLNLQANTPVHKVSERDSEGYITVTTDRGQVRAKAVMHATVSRLALGLTPDARTAGPAT